MRAVKPTRVLLVDDSVVVRHTVQDVLRDEEGIEVVGTAKNGREALASLEGLQVDVVVLDVEMPVLDGLGTLEQLRPRWPTLPVIMFSTLTERGASATLDALALGASDYVTKPSRLGNRQAVRDAILRELAPLLRTWGRIEHARRSDDAPAAPVVPVVPVVASRSAAAGGQAPKDGRGAGGERRAPYVEAVLIGSSTGGPNALAEIVPSLPDSLRVPVLIVQHMPPMFTRLLAERLDQRSKLTVEEGAAGTVVRPGHVYVAPGGVHMTVCRERGEVRLVHDDGPPENSVKPAVDVLFRGAVEVWGGSLLGVVLTGMGSDGLVGSRALLEAGGAVLAQDEETSVVWGMPGAVSRAGVAQELLALSKVAPAIARYVGASRSEALA